MYDPTSGLSMVTCTSLFGGWLESYCGLENPLYEIFEGVTPEQIEILTSAAVSSITTAAATFVGGYIAAKATEWVPWMYALAMGLYAGGALLTFSLTYSSVEAYAARAILITLVGRCLGFQHWASQRLYLSFCQTS
jgi:hypothetical protein